MNSLLMIDKIRKYNSISFENSCMPLVGDQAAAHGCSSGLADGLAEQPKGGTFGIICCPVFEICQELICM